MKIKRLAIFSYGKWQNQTFDLDESLAIFYGDNEAGKSTLHSFIMSVLFGFPTKKSHRNLYHNAQRAQVHGGRLYVTDTAYGDLIIERTYTPKSKVTGQLKVFTERGEELSPKAVFDLCYQLTLDVYQRFFAFNAADLQRFATVNENELSHYFLALGSSGNDLLFQWMAQWRKQRTALFKEKGNKPPLNQALTTLAHLKEQWAAKRSNQEGYQALLAEQRHLQQQVTQIRQQLQQAQKEQQQLAVYRGVFAAYQEREQLTQQLKQTAHLASLSLTKQDLNQLEEQRNQSNADIAALSAQLEQLQHATVVSEEGQWYLDNSTDIKRMIRQLPKLDVAMSQSLTYTIQQQEKEEQLQTMKRYLQLPEGRLSVPLSPQHLQQATDLLEAEQHNVAALQEAEQVRTQQQQYRAQLAEEITAQQPDLLTQEEQQEVHRLDLRTQKLKEPHNHVMGACLTLAAFIGIGSTLLRDTAWQTGAWGTMVVLLLLAGVARWRYTQKKERYEHDKAYQAVLAEKLLTHQYAERAIVTAQRKSDDALLLLHDIDNQIAVIHDRQQELAQQQRQFKEQHHLDAAVPLPVFVSSDYVTVYQLQLAHDQVTEAIREQEQQLSEWLTQFAFFTEAFPSMAPSLSVTEQMRHVASQFRLTVDACSREEQQWHQIAHDMRTVQKQLTQAQEQQQQHTARISELLQQHDAADIATLHQLVDAAKLYREREERVALLTQQVRAYESVLATYADEAALQADEVRVAETVEKSNETIEQLQSDLAACTQKIHVMEQDGTLHDAEQAYENQRTIVTDLLASVAQYHLATTLIEELLSYGKTHRLQHILADATQLFATLTGDSYRAIVFHEEAVRVVRHDDQLVDLAELSQGTLEQLYVSLRLAFVANVADVAPMPVIIDDGFVNFDDQRRQRIYAVLKQFSEKVQIIIFSFDKTIAQYFDDRHIIRLDVQKEGLYEKTL